MKEPVFLDRDGVINRNRDDYVRSLGDWDPIPGSIEAIVRLSSSGHPVIVVTNQSAIARNYCSEDTVLDIHRHLEEMVEEAGGSILGVYYCPHHPDDSCECRKPAIGMVNAARSDLGLPPGGYIVGDALSDMELGRRAGLRTILVLTGRGEDQLRRMAARGLEMPWRVAADLAEAADIITGGAAAPVDGQ